MNDRLTTALEDIAINLERIAEALMPLTAFLPSALMEKLQQAIDFYDYDEALALLPPDTL